MPRLLLDLPAELGSSTGGATPVDPRQDTARRDASARTGLATRHEQQDGESGDDAPPRIVAWYHTWAGGQ